MTKFFASAVAVISLVPSVLGLTINTPADVVECQPILLTWTDGTPPYFLSFTPNQQTSAAPIKQFPPQSGTNYTWVVDLQGNTLFTMVLSDSTGTQAFSSLVTIQSSSNSTCLNTTVMEGSTSATTSTTASSSGSATSSGSTPSHSSNNAASRFSAGAFGVAGFMGLIGAALF